MPRRRSLAIAGSAVAALTLTVATVAFAFPPQNFVTPLSAGEEVPANASSGRGAAIFQVRGDTVEYRLIASNIDNVIMAHIHMAGPGSNGPIVVWLYPDTSPPPATAGGGRQDGVLATGSFSAANLTGPLAGQPLSALVDLLESGGAYVNVHTDDGVAPSNTGPGDLPGGEIRGQID